MEIAVFAKLLRYVYGLEFCYRAIVNFRTAAQYIDLMLNSL